MHDACVAIGGKYVLYDAAKKMTYQLDNQKMPVKFAGCEGQGDWGLRRIHQDHQGHQDRSGVLDRNRPGGALTVLAERPSNV